METLSELFKATRTLLDISLFRLGSGEFTLWTLIYIILFTILLIYLAGRLNNWIANRLLSQSRLHLGVRQAVGSLIRYVIIAVGLVIILQTAGIDLTTLNVIAGAVGIGVGFGLQDIASNFISGLVILFERPIKIGDRIEVGGVEGDVTRIGARSTSVLTNDNISIIIPNAKLISENVINWSHNDERVRFRVSVGVAYGSDVRLVEKVLVEAARENRDVLERPEPAVRFMKFGDSSLDFELRVWTTSLTHRKGILISDLNFAIFDKFKLHGIEIPFPQRDLHIRTGSFAVSANSATAEETDKSR